MRLHIHILGISNLGAASIQPAGSEERRSEELERFDQTEGLGNYTLRSVLQRKAALKMLLRLVPAVDHLKESSIAHWGSSLRTQAKAAGAVPFPLTMHQARQPVTDREQSRGCTRWRR